MTRWPALAVVLTVGLAGALAGDPEGRVPRDVRTEVFATAVSCAPCHDNRDDSAALRDGRGRGIAPYGLWRGSMMANAARDPFFQAAVAAEVLAAPDRKEEIEARCLHCHAPMASMEERRAGRKGLSMAALGRTHTEDEQDLAALALDGVSCTLCHQILPENLGKPESLDGGFAVGEWREIYGPHDELFVMPMWRIVKYWPVEGHHMTLSAHCGTCHTALLEGGVPELAPYLEWRNSAYDDERAKPGPAAATCQACHQPRTSDGGAPIRTRIAHASHAGDIRWIEPREPVGRHLFAGGNTLLPAILRDHATELGVKAPPEAFDEAIARAREMLEERTARLAIERVSRDPDLTHFTVSIGNLAGHKFPTGHSSRRAWLRLRARDPEGKLLLAWGEHDREGRILGADGVPLPSELAGGPIAPHQLAFGGAGDVPVFEAILADAKGAPVFRSVLARGYAKDNRLLPLGWSAEHEDAPKTAPKGTAGDADFEAGGDKVRCAIPVPVEIRVFSIEVELLYQTLSPRHAAELFRADTPEVRRFQTYYEAADRTPVVVAIAGMVVGEDG
jgi:hypothetical protein